jgi:tRNA threonylcarbamoyladenosine biosynthesis protein TsaE
MRLRTRSVDETRDLAARLAPELRPGDLVVLAGDLGSGKTVFAQGVARGLGIEETVTSPTFTIVHEYEGPVRLAHVDVYRLDRVQELHDLGFDELVDDGRVTLVEWGDVIARSLPPEHLVVRIALGAGDERDLALEFRGPRWRAREARVAAALERFAVDGDAR